MFCAFEFVSCGLSMEMQSLERFMIYEPLLFSPHGLITHHLLHQYCPICACSKKSPYSSIHLTVGTPIPASRALAFLFPVDTQFFIICLPLHFLGKSPKSFLLFFLNQKNPSLVILNTLPCLIQPILRP